MPERLKVDKLNSDLWLENGGWLEGWKWDKGGGREKTELETGRQVSLNFKL